MTMSRSQQLKREILFFVISGVIATLTDFAIYCVLQLFIYYSVAKTVSFLTGSFVAYLLNKFFTFKRHERSHIEMLRFITLYATSLIVNVSANSLGILVLHLAVFSFLQLPDGAILLLAFLGATGISMVMNFIGQRFWVFKTHQLVTGTGHG